jgi:hypothetical protein
MTKTKELNDLYQYPDRVVQDNGIATRMEAQGWLEYSCERYAQQMVEEALNKLHSTASGRSVVVGQVSGWFGYMSESKQIVTTGLVLFHSETPGMHYCIINYQTLEYVPLKPSEIIAVLSAVIHNQIVACGKLDVPLQSLDLIKMGSLEITNLPLDRNVVA